MAQLSYLEIVGIIWLSLFVLKLLLSVLRGLWTTCLAHRLGFGIKWKPGDHVWAVITGATDGIGLQYAKQLAQKGYNLVIISRSEDKLMATQKSLLNDYKNCKQVKTIAVDFNRTDIYDKITRELNGVEVVDVLVNNVGTLSRCADYFLDIGSQMNETYFKVNMFSYIRLIEIVLPKMVQQNRGIVINVSSQTALAPVPLMTTYAATKAFITFLSEGLSVEYESKGVTIQTVMPSMTKTKLLHGSHRSSFFAVTPEDFVSSAINTVGIETLTFGHWKHKLLVYIIEWFTYVCGNRFTANLALKVLKQSRDEYYMRINSKIE